MAGRTDNSTLDQEPSADYQAALARGTRTRDPVKYEDANMAAAPERDDIQQGEDADEMDDMMTLT